MATSTSYQIQAAEINAVLQLSFVDAVLNTPISLSGATVTLVATPPVVKGTPVKQSYPCTISGDNTTASYTTTGTDFVTVGKWSCQGIYVGPLGTHHGPIIYLNVLPNL